MRVSSHTEMLMLDEQINVAQFFLDSLLQSKSEFCLLFEYQCLKNRYADGIDACYKFNLISLYDIRFYLSFDANVSKLQKMCKIEHLCSIMIAI